MQEMPQCLVLLCTLDQGHVKVEHEEQASITHMVIQALLKQSVERIARLREVSCCSHYVSVVVLYGHNIHLVIQVLESLTAYVVWENTHLCTGHVELDSVHWYDYSIHT